MRRCSKCKKFFLFSKLKGGLCRKCSQSESSESSQSHANSSPAQSQDPVSDDFENMVECPACHNKFREPELTNGTCSKCKEKEDREINEIFRWLDEQHLNTCMASDEALEKEIKEAESQKQGAVVANVLADATGRSEEYNSSSGKIEDEDISLGT